VRVSPVAALGLVAVLAVAAAACGGKQAASAPSSVAPCKLDRAQRHTVALALADIRRLRRIQAPVQTFSLRGGPGQDVMTGKLERDLGSSHLPPNVFSHLLHLGKIAVNLCGQCSQALEAEEPFLGHRTGGRGG
jgi:hypothetical protein